MSLGAAGGVAGGGGGTPGGGGAGAGAPGGPGGKAGGRRLPGVLVWVVIAALVLGFAAIGGSGGSGGPPLDPSSTSPGGAKALALLLDQLGARRSVVGTPPLPGTEGSALVLEDRLSPADQVRLVDWVRAGGRLVIADPQAAASFAAPARQPGPGGLVTAAAPLEAECGSVAVDGVGQIDPAGGVAYRPPTGATGCFPVVAGGDFMVVVPEGAGTLVLLGGPLLWTNAYLGKLDNSVLAANLLVPAPGTNVTWLIGARPGSGHASLLDLMPARFKEGLIGLLVALALLGLWRARRLGRPVREAPVVELPGSELVVAIGNLLNAGRRSEQAGAILRAALARQLADQFGLPASTDPQVLADLAAGRAGVDRQLVFSALAGPLPTDERGLVVMAQSADRIRQEIADARQGV